MGEIKELTRDFADIQRYSDFASEGFKCKTNTSYLIDFSLGLIVPQNATDQSIHKLLSLDGVPTYFVLDYSSKLKSLGYLNGFLLFFTDRIVWKGRLCARDQLTYDMAMNHMINECQQQLCSTENCDLCPYRLMTDAQTTSVLNSNN